MGQYFNFIVFANWNDESTGCETGRYNSVVQDKLKTDATAYNTTFPDGSYIRFIDFESEMGANAEGSRTTIVGYKFQAWIDPSEECKDTVIAECDSVINNGRTPSDEFTPLFVCNTKGYAVTSNSIAMTETSDDFMSSSEYLTSNSLSNYNKFYVTYSQITYNILYGGDADVTGLPISTNGIYASLESDAKVTSIDTGSFGDKVLYAKYDVVDSGEDSTPTPPAVTATPSVKPTVTPSVKPTETPSATSTATPSITPTVKPSASPSTSPSIKPSSSPSGAPTVKPSDSPNPTVKPQETANTKPQITSDVQATPSTKPVTVNVVTKGGITYKVKSNKSCVVTKCKKKIKKAVVQKKVKFVINGKTVTYKVTGIEKNVFKNCKKLKSLTIKSTTIKKIAKNAFKGVSKKCKVKVPKKQFKKYRKLLKKAKFKGKVKKIIWFLLAKISLCV